MTRRAVPVIQGVGACLLSQPATRLELSGLNLWLGVLRSWRVSTMIRKIAIGLVVAAIATAGSTMSASAFRGGGVHFAAHRGVAVAGGRGFAFRRGGFIGRRAFAFRRGGFIGRRAFAFRRGPFIGRRAFAFRRGGFVGPRAFAFRRGGFVGRRAFAFRRGGFVGRRGFGRAF
jgi:hypothetical protein